MIYLPRVWTLITLLMAASLFAKSQTASTPAECQDEVLRKAKKTFMSLYHARQADPSAVSDEEFRQASRNYAQLANSCYAAKYGTLAETGRIIDHGALHEKNQEPYRNSRDFYGPGLRHGTSDSGNGLSNPVTDSRSPYKLYGTKWGSGTSFKFGAGSNVLGPGTPGGTVTYSFMADGVDLGAHEDAYDSQTVVKSCPDVPGGNFADEIRAAFKAWEAVTNIQFVEVTDSGHAFDTAGASGDIRICMHQWLGDNGPNGPVTNVGHAWSPPPNGTSKAGDIHFDTEERWRCDPEQDDHPINGHDVNADTGMDIGIVALHLIGHAIGLDHEPTVSAGTTNELAVMNPNYNPSIDVPLVDDIQAAQQIYGSAFRTNAFFGTLGVNTSTPTENLEVSGNIKVSSYSNYIGWSAIEGFITSGGEKPMFVSPGQVLMSIDVDNDDTSHFFAVGKDSTDPGKWTELFRVQENGYVGIGKINPSYPMEFASGARVTSGGQFQNASSRQSKERIQDLTDSEAAEVVSKLEPVRFAYKADPEENQVGFIAEDVPDLVATKDRKTLAAMGIVAALTKVVQQQQETDQQQQELAQQQQRVIQQQQEVVQQQQAAILELSAKVAQLQEQVVRIREQ